MLPPGAIFELKIYQNAFVAGTLLRTTALPRSSSCFWGPLRGKGREGKKGEEGGEGKGKRGSVPPLLFSTI